MIVRAALNFRRDVAAKVPDIADLVSGAEADGSDTIQLVVYDLPGELPALVLKIV